MASFTLTADGVRTAAPGGQGVFPHILTNTGNGSDTFPLSLVNLGGDDFDLTGLAIYADADGNGVPDNFTPLATTGPLAAGGVFRFVVVGNVPGTQVGGDIALHARQRRQHVRRRADRVQHRLDHGHRQRGDQRDQGDQPARTATRRAVRTPTP